MVLGEETTNQSPADTCFERVTVRVPRRIAHPRLGVPIRLREVTKPAYERLPQGTGFFSAADAPMPARSSDRANKTGDPDAPAPDYAARGTRRYPSPAALPRLEKKNPIRPAPQ